MFVLSHQDGNIEYEFVRGGFDIDWRRRITISIEAKALKADAFPDTFMFCLEKYPLGRYVERQKFMLEKRPQGKTPNVHVYTTFHAFEISGDIEIVAIDKNSIEVVLNVISEDVNYYDERSKPNPFKGSVQLSKVNRDQLWVPV